MKGQQRNILTIKGKTSIENWLLVNLIKIAKLHIITVMNRIIVV